MREIVRNPDGSVIVYLLEDQEMIDGIRFGVNLGGDVTIVTNTMTEDWLLVEVYVGNVLVSSYRSRDGIYDVVLGVISNGQVFA